MRKENQQNSLSAASDAISAAIDSATSIASVPLIADTARQAIPSIRGTVYQAWQSIDAWLRQTEDSTAIYLEGAEDFDVVREDGAVTVQVRNTTQSISLNTQKALKALQAFWNVRCKQPHRRVEQHYLTTSSVCHETDGDFGGLTGIDAWRVARTDADMTRKITTYLVGKLGGTSPLRSFLLQSAVETVQECLIQRFGWFTDQPDLEAVKHSVDDRIVALLATQKRPLTLVTPIRTALEAHFWEVVLRPRAEDRRLTRGELLRQVAQSTHTYLPVPLEQLPALLSVVYPGLGLLRMLLQKVPPPPSPLLDRPALTQKIRDAVQQRKAVLITGTVNKGKTTLAQVAAHSLCSDAWWLNVTGRPLNELDNLLLALAQRIEEGAAPNLIILDDFDISETAYRMYRSSLALVLHRARITGRGVLLTAQGSTKDSGVVRELEGIELLEVHALDEHELKDQCVQLGCPTALTDVWTTFVLASTRGHPKLVQVRLEELRVKGWQVRRTEDLFGTSLAVMTERQIARRILSQSIDPPVAELVYVISESSVPLHRSIAVQLAESLPNLTNAGDVLDGLAGKWLERIEPNEVRATALLHGVASEIWSPEKRRKIHALLHDTLRSKTPLTPEEAAATLFHAYVAQEPRRISLAAMGLQLVNDAEATNQVNRNLQWLSWIALEPGQRILEEPHTAAVLRSMQFRVATTIESDALIRICERWAEDIERIEHVELRLASRALRWMSIGISTRPIPLRLRLDAVTGASALPPELRRNTHLPEDIAGSSAQEVTAIQAMLSCATSSVRCYAALEELATWLEQSANDAMRSEFESILEWPAVQAMGAFVHSAWTAEHEETTDWKPWLALFCRLENYAQKHRSPRLGREASKARAIVLTEYLDRLPEALDVLRGATEMFGNSLVLQEQRANTLFHAKDDAAVLNVWRSLQENDADRIALDAFAYRRAAISATRLQRWKDAEQFFMTGSNAVSLVSSSPMRFGLRADAALTRALSGDLSAAARMLVGALDILPEEAAMDGELVWEVTLRIASEICRLIDSRALGGSDGRVKVDPGWVSSPNLKTLKAEPGQPVRALLFHAEVRTLAACLCIGGPQSSQQLDTLLTCPYWSVRMLAAEGQLALAYDTGGDPDLIGSLLAFERVVINDAVSRAREAAILEPDLPDNSASPPPRPERIRSLLVAGVICAGDHLIERLTSWEKTSVGALGTTAPLSLTIRSLLDGACQPENQLENTVRTHSNNYVRLGAAARLLANTPSAQLTLQLQLLLISGIVDEVGIAFQKLWNIHVANQFAQTWRLLAANAFQFVAPRSSVPNLLAAIDSLEKGTGSLGRLVAAAQAGLRGQTPPFMSRVR